MAQPMKSVIKTVFYRRMILAFGILLLGALSITSTGCRLLRVDKQAKAEKKQAEANKKADAEYEKAREQHYKHQSKETKKRMKQTKKQAAKYNKPLERKGKSKNKCTQTG